MDAFGDVLHLLLSLGEDDCENDADHYQTADNQVYKALAGLFLMMFSLNQLFLGLLDVVSGRGHVLIQSHEFLALRLHLNVDVFGNCVDVLHYRLDLPYLLLSLLYDLFHVIGLSYQLHPTGTRLLSVFEIPYCSWRLTYI